jgi:anti-anti-sigma regulatory factor
VQSKRTGEHTLRITIQDTELTTVLTLEGRVAGPWAAELGRVWVDEAPRLNGRKLALDISNVIFADADGARVLKDIYAQAHPTIVATTPWTRYLAEQMSADPQDPEHDPSEEEQENADNE